MNKMTGSEVLKLTSGTDTNVLTGQILDYISIMNPSAPMTLTVNEGDEMFIPTGTGFTSADIHNLSRINKVIIKENGVNYYWQGFQVGEDSKV